MPTTRAQEARTEGIVVDAINEIIDRLPELATVAEVARALRRGQRTIYEQARTNGLPAVKIAGAWRIPREALRGWVLAQVVR
jgi:excisionase family DNA binding protein